jgi:uncharacterized protein (UPF0333 family)
MNNKAQVMIYGFMLAVTIIILAMAFAYPIWQAADNARSETTDAGGIGLNCTNPNLSNYDKSACIITDLTPFYFVGILVFIAGVVITAKIVFN